MEQLHDTCQVVSAVIQGETVVVTDEVLMAFADGELPLAQRIQVERAVAADPEAQARIAMFRETTALLRAAVAMEEDGVDRA
jgi:anti-sigma factor RsiW